VFADRASGSIFLSSNDPLIELDTFVWQKMERDRIPGVAACIIKHGEVVWAETYGWADIERRIPMSLDGLQNQCSISKTFTSTAVMQLQETGLVSLDDDINDYFSFPVRHPKDPDQPITIKQLLTHTSSIDDGLDYSKLYACGDPRFALSTWLREYFTPGGEFYDSERNFHSWLPADNRWMYCNLAYGVLAHLVEVVAGMPFPHYCRLNIFSRLGMESTSWYLADIDLSRHVVPYTWAEGGKPRGPDWGGMPLGVIREDGPTHTAQLEDGFHSNCAYSHPNYPDGFLRSSVNDLSRYLRAYLGSGAFDGRRILRSSTVRDMLDTQLVAQLRGENGLISQRNQGLNWYAEEQIGGELTWGHGGSDPGINNDIRFLPSQGIGTIVFTNTNDISPEELTSKFLKVAIRSRF
jgi:CubicO group peptidase (beta-lactamase class C family)